MSTTAVSDATFKSAVLESDKPVLVDYWAPWCKPCLELKPILEEVASEHSDSLSVVTVNIDENTEIATNAGIMSVPTMHVYKGGELVKSIVGSKPKAALLAELQDVIA